MEHCIKAFDPSCSGCRACEAQCPVGAIRMVENEEGFLYPAVNAELCVDCGKCQKICPMIHPAVQEEEQFAYAAYWRDEVGLTQCASGGVFSALAEQVLRHGGAVCGCGYDDSLRPKHFLVDSTEELSRLKGSKYVQSDVGDTYAQIRTRLEAGQSVLFAGTPCQVAGLRRALGKSYEALYCCDLICHGVPSAALFRSYLDWLESKQKGRLRSYNFRSKRKNGWSLTYCAEVERNKSKRIKRKEAIASLDPYYYAFLEGMTYRESCYMCPYSQLHRAGDITLGDFWGVEREYPGMANPKGVSAVIVNTDRGKALLSSASEQLVLEPVAISSLQKHQGNLSRPTARPMARDEIYTCVRSEGFDRASKKYMRTDRYAVEWVRNLLPNSIRQKIKKIIRR